MGQSFPRACHFAETGAVTPFSLYPCSLFTWGIVHEGKALVSKLYFTVQALGGMSHFMDTSVFQLSPSVL